MVDKTVLWSIKITAEKNHPSHCDGVHNPRHLTVHVRCYELVTKSTICYV